MIRFLFWLPLVGGCSLLNSAGKLDFAPSRVPVGELVLGTWLPAGLPDLRFSVEEQRLLAAVGINQLEWLQRAVAEDGTAEEVVMRFCSRIGLRLPIYYEPPGYTPYDKLHNWTTRSRVEPSSRGELRRVVRDLFARWNTEPGFGGYLVGHEDYRKEYYPALRQTVEVIREVDGMRPALTVGHIDNYPAVQQFLQAFFIEGGVPNVFQHEHYVFRATVPREGPNLRRQLGQLAAGYERVARYLAGLYGRWHAIVQVHEEEREDGLFYRQPTEAEIRVQAGLALARGASGIIFFLYSSGVEERRNVEGQLTRRWIYRGLVDENGLPRSSYTAVRRLNAQLRELSDVLESLHFYGDFSSDALPENPVIATADPDLDFGLFGDGNQVTHLLVVNRRTTVTREVLVELVDGLSARAWDTAEAVLLWQGNFILRLEAGGFRMLEVTR